MSTLPATIPGLDELMAHNEADRRTYALTLDGKTHLISTDEAAADEIRRLGFAIAACDDVEAMGPLLADMPAQGRALMKGGLVLALERLDRAMGRVAIINAPRPLEGELPYDFNDHEEPTPWTLPVNDWGIHIDPAQIYRSPDPNDGVKTAPPRREWWATNGHKGKGTPGNGNPWNDPYRDSRGVKAHPIKKATRKAQKAARRKNR